MHRTLRPLSPVVLLMVTSLQVAAEIPEPRLPFQSHQAGDMKFLPMPSIPGASVALLFGHPNEEGPYVMRYRVPANTLMAAHYHDQDRHVTVISGTWAFGKGDSGACKDTEAMVPGSYIFHPAGQSHFDGSCTNEPIEIQVNGEGPVKNFLAR